MSRRMLLMFFLLATGSAAVAVGLRAMAQQPAATTPAAGAAAAGAAAGAAAAPATPAAAAEPALTPDDADLRQSADNNISFPVDI